MKLLVLQHVAHEHPGYISQYAGEKGIELDIIELWKSYSIPDFLDYDAVILMGGPMGAYEDYPSRDDEVIAIQKAVGRVPIIGFCLGCQLLAYALGAKVYPNVQDGKKVKEVGYFAIDLMPEGKSSKILANFPSTMKALEWHGDIFELPKNSALLATTPLVKNQAFSYKNAHGFLFHFEFTPEMIATQIEIDKEWIHEDNDLDEANLVKEATDNAQLMKKQCFTLLDNFLGSI